MGGGVVPDLVLSDREQDLMRSLLALEPVPGEPLPSAADLELVARLIPSDTIGVALADSTGRVIRTVSLPSLPLQLFDSQLFDPQVCDGPLSLGIVHQSRDRGHRKLLAREGIADGLVLGFRNGPDHVVQLCLDRHRRMFSAHDLGLLKMMAPALQRLLRERPTPRLPATLTLTERRVLRLLATGMTNADIAAYLGVAPCTVRKHLEHAFPKLGVTNRLAAARAFETGTTHREGAEMFA
jgi:DNA-binding CsgD family transcriptional regulator